MVLLAIKVVDYIFSMLRISLAGFPKKWSANEAQFTWPCPLWGSPSSFTWPTPQLGSDPALSLQWGSWALHLHKKKHKPSLPSCLAQWLHLLSSPALQHHCITYLTQTWAVFYKCLQRSERVGSVHSASTSRTAPCSYTALVPFLQHVPPLWPLSVEQRSGYPRLQFT